MDEKNDDNIDIYTYKIILLGDSDVSKTSLIARFCDDIHENMWISEIGIYSKTKFVKRKDKKIELKIWDTFDQEKFRSLAKYIINKMDGMILVYDIGNKLSFKSIKMWYNNLREIVDFKKVGIILVGINSDKIREISEKMAQEFCQKNNITFIEASTKNKKEVDDVFFKLIDIMININPKKNKNLISSTEDDVKPKKKGFLVKNEKYYNY